MSVLLATCEIPSATLPPGCNHCKKSVRELPAGSQLKLCNGCSVAKYCSRDCQKAAWRDHRPLCRPAQDRVLTAGYSAPLTLVSSLQEWCDDIHKYTLGTLVNAAVHLSGGIAANFTEPRLVLLRLRRVNNPDNPAMAFQLCPERPPVVDRAYCPDLFSSWATQEDLCQKQADFFRSPPSESDPTYVGSLTASLFVEGTTIGAYRPYPIYAFKSLDTGPLNARARAILEDIVDLCIGYLSAGIVLREPPQGTHQRVPDAGLLVQIKKKWVWGKLISRVGFSGRPLNAGSSPRDVWMRYYEL